MASDTSVDQIVEPAPRRPVWSFYYGWVNLIVAAVAMSATLPGRTHGLGVITEQLLADLDISPEDYSAINFGAILIGTLLCWPTGWLIDRFGTRTVATVVSLALGGVVIWMSRATDSLSLFFALLLTRGLGQTALSVVSMAVVGKWFTRQSGRAMGVYAALLSIGSIVAYMGLLGAVDGYGWRAGWEGMGWALIVGLAPLCLLLVRSTPSVPSLAHQVCEVPGRTDCQSVLQKEFTLKQALLTPAFWAFGLATAFFNLVWSAISLFQQSILKERGFGDQGKTFAIVMGILVISGTVSNLVSGWLAQKRISLGRLLMIGLLLLGAGLIYVPFVTTQPQAMLYGLAMGVASGPIIVVFFSVWGQVFGRTNLGKIQSAAQVLTVFASASGPWLLTKSRIMTGNFNSFFWTSAGAAILLALIVWLTPRADVMEAKHVVET